MHKWQTKRGFLNLQESTMGFFPACRVRFSRFYHRLSRLLFSSSALLLFVLNRELQRSVGTAGPQPRASDLSGHCRTSTASARFQWALLDLNRELQSWTSAKRQRECQIECQNGCQIERQKECQRECQNKCQKVCQNRCQIECQIECQSLCQKECQIECQNKYAHMYLYIYIYLVYIMLYTSKRYVRN